MLVNKSGVKKSNVEQIGAKEDNKDVRITNKNDVTRKIKNKPDSRSPLKEDFYNIGLQLEKQFESCDFSFDAAATKSDVPICEICQKELQKSSNEPVKKSEEKSSPEKNQLRKNKYGLEFSELPKGLWFKEPLFFTHDDPLFEGALLKFVKYIDPEYAKRFCNLRKPIKCVLRYKVQKVRQHGSKRRLLKLIVIIKRRNWGKTF